MLRQVVKNTNACMNDPSRAGRYVDCTIAMYIMILSQLQFSPNIERDKNIMD